MEGSQYVSISGSFTFPPLMRITKNNFHEAAAFSLKLLRAVWQPFVDMIYESSLTEYFKK